MPKIDITGIVELFVDGDVPQSVLNREALLDLFKFWHCLFLYLVTQKVELGLSIYFYTG